MLEGMQNLIYFAMGCFGCYGFVIIAGTRGEGENFQLRTYPLVVNLIIFQNYM